MMRSIPARRRCHLCLPERFSRGLPTLYLGLDRFRCPGRNRIRMMEKRRAPPEMLAILISYGPT